MLITLLNGALVVQIKLEKSDISFDDNICMCFEEPCPDDEKIFRGTQTHLYLTATEAREIAKELLAVAEESDIYSQDAI
ncbi:MAG: hypothetical protein BGO78_08125 [Chloroflexi bacterium 44-23]|nr:MAG: hypothetical protein BGO78_08125 [Chloroflexi bacterium 44-23]